MGYYKITATATPAGEYLVEAVSPSAAIAKLVVMQPAKVKTLNTSEVVSMMEAGASVVRATKGTIDTVTVQEGSSDDS
ncbi:hypothetical protein KAR91_59920 [Candidatus Pacearchaeota archaeon]|nr:hypothetical protein [Candidatus Pacearchaeota archaeon]